MPLPGLDLGQDVVAQLLAVELVLLLHKLVVVELKLVVQLHFGLGLEDQV